MKPYSLYQRAELYNRAFPNYLPLHVAQNYKGESFVYGFWFVGLASGKNHSGFYGSYQTAYLERIVTLFPDCKGKTEVLHLFSGSLPGSDDYTRVGIDPTGQYKTDLEIDAHKLSSYLPFNPSLIYADPPYSVEDSEHYKNSMVNRAVVLEQCGLVLKPGGYVVWLDQALPVFDGKTFELVGAISYIRSTGNRFRVICLFRKHVK